ncbi:uncharacterized protein LOC129234616 [Uloborus diversus]|uniref:uncharacterized protein LOC129234616 n=1 Tax=Uloborus diversus TaxID=327109 RepID=UPI00240959B5|nr:uncharacterized protein LOC129234616 [Uloborus diversus]
MGKKVKGQDNYERICFMFEAAYTLLIACPSNVGLICSYGHMIKMLSQRTQSKLGPYIKRLICKKCHLVLRPGVTSDVRLKSKHTKHILVTCKLCGTPKRFLSKPDYELFFDKVKRLGR